MRLWSLHPEYLDRQGLLALWREGLLAQKVLMGETKGYRHHPQLERFKACEDPVGAVAAYLAEVAAEARRRDYNFNLSKLARPADIRIECPRGQLEFEWGWLRSKLAARSPDLLEQERYAIDLPRPHPIFRVAPGPRAGWEKS